MQAAVGCPGFALPACCTHTSMWTGSQILYSFVSCFWQSVISTLWFCPLFNAAAAAAAAAAAPPACPYWAGACLAWVAASWALSAPTWPARPCPLSWHTLCRTCGPWCCIQRYGLHVRRFRLSVCIPLLSSHSWKWAFQEYLLFLLYFLLSCHRHKESRMRQSSRHYWWRLPC